MPRQPFGLSPREAEVISLVARGCTNQAIAIELQVSVSTVRGHIESILRKLDAANRTEAVARWLDRPHPNEGTQTEGAE